MNITVALKEEINIQLSKSEGGGEMILPFHV
jgi:hypothetical protein